MPRSVQAAQTEWWFKRFVEVGSTTPPQLLSVPQFPQTTAMVIFFIAAMLVLGFADFAIKQGSGRISAPLGTLIYAASATLLALVWTLWTRAHQPLQVSREGILWSAATGLAFSIFTGILFFLFSHGVNLSIGTPILRLGGMLLAALLSFVVLREPVNLQYVIGFILAAAGILLIATR